MNTSRNWSHLPSRLKSELNGMSGIVTAGGGVAAIGSISLFAGTVAIACSGVGAIFMIGGLGYAVYQAFPPRLKHPKDLVGQTLPLKVLNELYPNVISIAIVGPTLAGKTTLERKLSFLPCDADPTRTQEITARIVALQVAPPAYAAILDGGGERYAQQFKIAENCDCLCILFDHNVSNKDVTVSEERLRENRDFLKQIRIMLSESKNKKKEWIWLLRNKRDLWSLASEVDRNKFTEFFAAQTKEWKNANLAHKVVSKDHSNEIQDDVSNLMALIKTAAVND